VSTPGTFYVLRQARTRVIGSRVMTEAEANREAQVWAAEIGPAVAVPATPALAQAVRFYDQDVLVPILYPPPPPKPLTPAQARILAEVNAAGFRVYNGRARKQVAALEAAGLVRADWDSTPHAHGSGMRLTERITVRAVAS
jgi:hypothetical protein